MPAHTPGPRVGSRAELVQRIQGQVTRIHELTGQRDELLAALEWAMGYLPTEDQSVTWMRGHAQARAAIARARGGK